MLEKIANKNAYWLRVAYSFGVGDYAPDIVQEMYLKVHKYIEAGTLKEETATTYVYCIIRSLCLDLKRVQKKYAKVDIEDYQATNLNNQKEIEALNTIYDKIDKEINSWRWYDAKLFKTYIDSDYSQRDLAKGTKINVGSIHYTLRKAGDKLREKFSEDFEDFFNKDYELIKK